MKEAQDSIPPLFKCPISLDLFKDPVTLSTGQTYERSNIDKWFSLGNLTCPVTMQNLQDTSFIPNNTLRHLITQWLQMTSDQLNPPSLSALDSLTSLTAKLQSRHFSFDYKIQILHRVRILCEEFPSTCLIQLGFLSVLLELVFGQGKAKLSHEYQEFVEQALDFVVAMVSTDDLKSFNVLMEESKLSRFMVLFRHGTVMMKISLCHLIEKISSSVEARDLSAFLGCKMELLRAIVQLLHSEASDAAAKAISSLSKLEENVKNLVVEGAVGGLIAYISNAQKREGSSARVGMGAIEKLLVMKRAKEEMMMHNGNGVNVIVKMVFRVLDDGGSESAVNSLIMLCYDSFEAREEAIRGGVLSQLLLLLQSQCCAKTKTKARILLKLLRSKWVEDKRNL